MSAVLDMPTDKSGKGRQDKTDAPKPQFTTLRLYAEDGDQLSKLADERGKTIADLYRELFAATVRKTLIVEKEKSLAKLRQGM